MNIHERFTHVTACQIHIITYNLLTYLFVTTLNIVIIIIFNVA